MLTISQLAAHAGVTVRTVRHYHQCGLLPEPPRDHSGYRRYDGRAVVDLVRIRTLAAAGVPLSRMPELLEADDASFAASVAEVDRDLSRQIRELQRHRRDLAKLATPERLCLSDGAIELMDRMREVGLCERTLTSYRDSWILLGAVYPDALADQIEWTRQQLEHPAYVGLLLQAEEAFDWDPDDPRLQGLAEQAAAVVAALEEELNIPNDPEVNDAERWQLLTEHSRQASPAWARLNELIDERVAGSR